MRTRPLIFVSGGLALALFTAWAAYRSGSTAAEPSLWSRMLVWILLRQREFHRELTQGLRTLSSDGGGAAAWSLVVASFLYGVFHAAGPGHGKAVLTAYLLTHDQRLGRSLGLATASAFCQGLVAVMLVYGLIFIAGWLPREASAAVAWAERASFALLVLIGAFIAARAGRSTVGSLRAALLDRGQRRSHPHEHGCGCGHADLLSPGETVGVSDLRTAFGVVLSIGLRPCSGAVLVLVFAQVVGLAGAGIGAVAAMSAGTALAVAGLAFLAVNTRRWAASVIAGRGIRWRLAADLATLTGGVVIFAMGISLFGASFSPSHPLGL